VDHWLFGAIDQTWSQTSVNNTKQNHPQSWEVPTILPERNMVEIIQGRQQRHDNDIQQNYVSSGCVVPSMSQTSVNNTKQNQQQPWEVPSGCLVSSMSQTS